MPEIGDVKRANQIGFKGRRKCIWVRCEVCGKERWKHIDKKRPGRTKCRLCFLIGAANPHWNGGIYHKPTGYKLILLSEGDFFYPMTTKHNLRKSRYVPEHRLIMAKSLGRCLHTWEEVHHKNGIRDDNRIENLELSSKGNHSITHSKGYRDGYAKGLTDGREKRIAILEQRVTLLEAENLLLRGSTSAQYVTPADMDLNKY